MPNPDVSIYQLWIQAQAKMPFCALLVSINDSLLSSDFAKRIDSSSSDKILQSPGTVEVLGVLRSQLSNSVSNDSAVVLDLILLGSSTKSKIYVKPLHRLDCFRAFLNLTFQSLHRDRSLLNLSTLIQHLYYSIGLLNPLDVCVVPVFCSMVMSFCMMFTCC